MECCRKEREVECEETNEGSRRGTRTEGEDEDESEDEDERTPTQVGQECRGDEGDIANKKRLDA